MYWSVPGAIFQAYLDGSNVKKFETQGVKDPDGMALDIREKK